MVAIFSDAGKFDVQLRLGAFFAISIALHLLMLAGAGRLDLSARRLGDAPARNELHATLVPGEASPPAAKASSHPGSEADGAREPAPEPAAENAGLGLPAPDKWYNAQEVDVRAQPLGGVSLRYPENLRSEPVTGKVTLRVFVDERGVVRKIQIAASEPPGMFDDAARKSWEQVRFSPAIKNGEPVKSQKLLELTYQPGLM